MIEVPLDVLKQFPIESIGQDNGECVGYSVSSAIGNYIGVPCDLEFNYAAGLWITNTTPETYGEGLYQAMMAAIVYGALPVLNEGPIPMPQLEAANFANYTPTQKQIAQQYAQRGLITLSSYTGIANYILQYKMAVPLAVSWYESFNTSVVNGVLPMPQPGEQPISGHCVAVFDSNVSGLVINAWTGGYLIMPPAVFNACYAAAFGFNPNASRWLSLAYAALQYPRRIPDILPQMFTTN